jgi:hypothetical protein
LDLQLSVQSIIYLKRMTAMVHHKTERNPH